MKKILLLFILFSCISVYGEEVVLSQYDKVLREQKTSNMASLNWGPYMHKLEEAIKKNWKPPINYNMNKKLITRFIVGSDGTINNIEIYQSSGEDKYDKAAIYAVKNAKFSEPLPKGFNRNSVAIEFAFDLNIRNSVQYTSEQCKTKLCKFFYEHQ